MTNEKADTTVPFEEWVKANPLINFSYYTLSQADAVRTLGEDIKITLQAATVEGGYDGVLLMKAYHYFWFWVLGAFEVFRTMDQHGTCFAPEVAKTIKSMKKHLATIRVPFAKQELSGRRGPIDGENSMSRFGGGSPGFTIDGKTYDMLETIADVIGLLNAIRLEDIIAGIPRQK